MVLIYLFALDALEAFPLQVDGVEVSLQIKSICKRL